MKKVSIVGFGRFGRTLYRLLKDDFEITIYKRHLSKMIDIPADRNVILTDKIEEIYKSEVVFYAVPIASFESVIRLHKKYFHKHVLIDVLSVKMYPAAIFKRYLKGEQVQAILTHPMFGPDSSKNGFEGLPLVIDKFMAEESTYDFWSQYFQSKGIKVIALSAKEHDKLAATSQGVTHFIGRLLQEYGYKGTSIDTLGARKLHEVVEQTCNDTWELFTNLQNYNPYTKRMRLDVGRAYDKLYNRLLPQRVSRHYIVYGIQGGKGSFNEQAIMKYIEEHKIKKYIIKYLYTSEKVLNNLHKGSIDYGLFAIHNSIGGIVGESVKAMSRYKFHIVEEFAIRIRHFLMKRKDIKTSDISTIMAHPQVLAQCKDTLKQRYSQYIQISGKGDLVDTATAAFSLSKGKLSKTTAILGPYPMSTMYDLEIIAEDLQDDKINNTAFLLVKR